MLIAEIILIFWEILIALTSPATPLFEAEAVVIGSIAAVAPTRQLASKGRRYAMLFKGMIGRNDNYRVAFDRQHGFALFGVTGITERNVYKCTLSHFDMKNAYWTLRMHCRDDPLQFEQYVAGHGGVIPDALGMRPLSQPETPCSEPVLPSSNSSSSSCVL